MAALGRQEMLTGVKLDTDPVSRRNIGAMERWCAGEASANRDVNNQRRTGNIREIHFVHSLEAGI
jgi:hypothetical protein